MATFALSKEKKVQRLVKYIKLLFLLLLPAMWLGQLEETESQRTMPQERRICTFEAEQPISERTIAHLYSEQIAVPVFTMKFACLRLIIAPPIVYPFSPMSSISLPADIPSGFLKTDPALGISRG